MARTKLSEQEWNLFLELANWLEIDVRGLMNQDVQFTILEASEHPLRREVAQMTTEQLSLARAERITEPQLGPTCQQRSPVVPRTRELETVDEPIELREPVCQSSACRRDLFPSASGVGIESARLQSTGRRQDRVGQRG